MSVKTTPAANPRREENTVTGEAPDRVTLSAGIPSDTSLVPKQRRRILPAATVEDSAGVGPMNNIRQCILVMVIALAFLSPAARSEQPQRAPRLTQEDRIKRLEERADAAERAASSAAMEKDYITRIQKQYESYYQKVFSTQLWTLGIMGLTLTGVFVLVARFSLNMIDERTKNA